MKIRSLLKIILIGLPLLLVAIIAVSYLFRNSLIQTAVETGGGYATGVTTTVAEVDFAPADGALTVNGLALANPEGFPQPTFLALGHAGMQVELASLFSETAEIRQIRLDSLSLELSRHDGVFNYQQILEHIARFESEGSETEGKYQVDQITITNVTALIALLPGGGELTRGGVTIEEITLTNLGSETQSLAGVTALVVQGVLKAVVEAGGAGLPEPLLNGLKSALGKSSRATAMQVHIRGVKTTGALDQIRSLTGDLMKGNLDLKENLQDLGQSLLGGKKK